MIIQLLVGILSWVQVCGRREVGGDDGDGWNVGSAGGWLGAVVLV